MGNPGVMLRKSVQCTFLAQMVSNTSGRFEMRTSRKARQLSFTVFYALASGLGTICWAQAQGQQGTQSPTAPKSGQPPSQETQSSQGQASFTSLAAKTVAFITVPYKDTATNKVKGISGTCFLVGFPDSRRKGQSFVYLVTNRHVADAEGAPPSTIQPVVYIRTNLVQPKNGESAVNTTITLTGSQHWYFPADPTVDLGVLPVIPNLQTIDMRIISVAMLATDEIIKSRSVGLGDPVFFVGYFSQFPGIQRADPIYRSGVLAMMPADPIPMQDDPTNESKLTPEHLWLADAHAFLGNSGSPLFINLGGFRNGTIYAGVSEYLLGVVNGFIPEHNGTVTGAATLEEATRQDLPNSGVLTFVPAQELRDLLYDRELQKLRDDAPPQEKSH